MPGLLIFPANAYVQFSIVIQVLQILSPTLSLNSIVLREESAYNLGSAFPQILELRADIFLRDHAYVTVSVAKVNELPL